MLLSVLTLALFGMDMPRAAECFAGVEKPSDLCGR